MNDEREYMPSSLRWYLFHTGTSRVEKQRTKAREHYKGERDGLSDPEVLVG